MEASPDRASDAVVESWWPWPGGGGGLVEMWWPWSGVSFGAPRPAPPSGSCGDEIVLGGSRTAPDRRGGAQDPVFRAVDLGQPPTPTDMGQSWGLGIRWDRHELSPVRRFASPRTKVAVQGLIAVVGLVLVSTGFSGCTGSSGSAIPGRALGSSPAKVATASLNDVLAHRATAFEAYLDEGYRRWSGRPDAASAPSALEPGPEPDDLMTLEHFFGTCRPQGRATVLANDGPAIPAVRTVTPVYLAVACERHGSLLARLMVTAENEIDSLTIQTAAGDAVLVQNGVLFIGGTAEPPGGDAM